MTPMGMGVGVGLWLREVGGVWEGWGLGGLGDVCEWDWKARMRAAGWSAGSCLLGSG
jgi:hypothetical protein